MIHRRWWLASAAGVGLAVLVGLGGRVQADQGAVQPCEDFLGGFHLVVKGSATWAFLQCQNQPAGFFFSHPFEGDDDEETAEASLSMPHVPSTDLSPDYTGVPQFTLMIGGKWMAETASYRQVILNIGPAGTAITPAALQQGALGNDVMLQEDWIAPTPLKARDQGQPVNHSIAIRTEDLDGRPLASVTPLISITDQATGVTRYADGLTLLAWNAVPIDAHYGQNLYLPDGTYTVTAMIGNEMATFPDVVVNAETGPRVVTPPAS